MNGIFRIDEYLPDTEQIIVRFCDLHSHKLIDEYVPVVISLSSLDTYDYDTFVQSLMRVGTDIINSQRKSEPVVNSLDEVEGKFNVENLVGKNIKVKIEDYRKGLIKMKKIDL